MNVVPLEFKVSNLNEPDECQEACAIAFARLVEGLVARGWSRKALALKLADIAEDYVLQLASR